MLMIWFKVFVNVFGCRYYVCVQVSCVWLRCDEVCVICFRLRLVVLVKIVVRMVVGLLCCLLDCRLVKVLRNLVCVFIFYSNFVIWMCGIMVLIVCFKCIVVGGVIVLCGVIFNCLCLMWISGSVLCFRVWFIWFKCFVMVVCWLDNYVFGLVLKFVFCMVILVLFRGFR